MTPVTINLTPEQSAEADAWTDGASYTFVATQSAPGMFDAVEARASEPVTEEPAPEGAMTAPAAGPANRGMGKASSNPAIALLIKGGGRK